MVCIQCLRCISSLRVKPVHTLLSPEATNHVSTNVHNNLITAKSILGPQLELDPVILAVSGEVYGTMFIGFDVSVLFCPGDSSPLSSSSSPSPPLRSSKAASSAPVWLCRLTNCAPSVPLREVHVRSPFQIPFTNQQHRESTPVPATISSTNKNHCGW